MQSFAAGMVGLAANGPAPEHIIRQRLKTCDGCEHLARHFVNRCRLCGCWTDLKAKVMSEKCPIDKWSSDSSNGKWAVGMTTAPRPQVTIRESVASFKANGWTPTIFAEPGSDLDGIDCPIVQHAERLGCWYNWICQAKSLLAWHPDAEWILTTQDDAAIVPGCRELAEAWDWPDDCGVLSFYLPTRSTYDHPHRRQRVRKPRGINPIDQQNMHGTLAVAFPRDVLKSIVSHRIAIEWGTRRKWRKPYLVDNDDICIGRCINALGLKMYYTFPSCCQHIATVSSRECARKNRPGARADWLAEHASEVMSGDLCHTAGTDTA